MQIIKEENLNLDELISELKAGKVIVYPTETCYGLGCDATNQMAVDKIFAIKKRQKDKPLLVIMSDLAMALKYVKGSILIDKIAEKYWPGALTLVTSSQENNLIAKGVLSVDSMLAFRVTSHPLAVDIVRALDVPFVSTSANIASEESPYNIDNVLKMFENEEYQPDIIIDSGVLPERSPSTVLKISDDKLQILRQGEIIVDFADLEK